LLQTKVYTLRRGNVRARHSKLTELDKLVCDYAETGGFFRGRAAGAFNAKPQSVRGLSLKFSFETFSQIFLRVIY
jgi:hypothetical protein